MSMTRREWWWRGPVLVLLVVSALAAGCASTTSLQLACDRVVNDGLLLTVDLVQVNESEAQEILRLGEEWFYSDLRRQLGARTTTASVETDPQGGAGRGCDRRVSLAKQKRYPIIAVIADYKTAGADAGGRNIQLLQKEDQGGTVRVALHGGYLTIE